MLKPVAEKRRPLCRVRVLFRKTETVRSVGEKVHFNGHVLFPERIGEHKRVLYRNSRVTEGVPDKAGGHVIACVKLTAELVRKVCRLVGSEKVSYRALMSVFTEKSAYGVAENRRIGA